MSSKRTAYLISGTLVVIAGFLISLGAVVAQIPICGPGGNCTEVDYLALTSGIGFGLLIAAAGGWLLKTGSRVAE